MSFTWPLVLLTLLIPLVLALLYILSLIHI